MQRAQEVGLAINAVIFVLYAVYPPKTWFESQFREPFGWEKGRGLQEGPHSGSRRGRFQEERLRICTPYYPLNIPFPHLHFGTANYSFKSIYVKVKTGSEIFM